MPAHILPQWIMEQALYSVMLSAVKCTRVSNADNKSLQLHRLVNPSYWITQCWSQRYTVYWASLEFELFLTLKVHLCREVCRHQMLERGRECFTPYPEHPGCPQGLRPSGPQTLARLDWGATLETLASCPPFHHQWMTAACRYFLSLKHLCILGWLSCLI